MANEIGTSKEVKKAPLRINATTLTGNLAADPKNVEYNQGKSHAYAVTVAVPNGKNKEGVERAPYYISVFFSDKGTFGYIAEAKKGDWVTIDARLYTNKSKVGEKTIDTLNVLGTRFQVLSHVKDRTEADKSEAVTIENVVNGEDDVPWEIDLSSEVQPAKAEPEVAPVAATVAEPVAKKRPKKNKESEIERGR